MPDVAPADNVGIEIGIINQAADGDERGDARSWFPANNRTTTTADDLIFTYAVRPFYVLSKPPTVIRN